MHADPIAFAKDWADAWNAHDIERVLAHFHDDATFSSPFAVRIGVGNEGPGVRQGRYPRLLGEGHCGHPRPAFTAEQVFAGVDHIVILYTNQKGDRVIEGHGTYPPDILNPTGART